MYVMCLAQSQAQLVLRKCYLLSSVWIVVSQSRTGGDGGGGGGGGLLWFYVYLFYRFCIFYLKNVG